MRLLGGLLGGLLSLERSGCRQKRGDGEKQKERRFLAGAVHHVDQVPFQRGKSATGYCNNE
jgi:hypothetical protein